VDVAPQFHLEIHGIALGAFDGSERLPQARIGRRIEFAAQPAEQSK